ncbi:MAG: hypothetical protein H0T74_12575 [Rubrobacteraceae bacterium]|nr:hypothetical protein [Rubrobacteraceae bacterium]
MPSSQNRRRLEVPRRLYDGLRQVAASEDRPVTSLVTDLLSSALPGYCWTEPDERLATKLDPHARRALTLAHEEANDYGHNYIGTEHVLIGVIREGEGVAARALGSLGVDLRAARVVVETIVGRARYPAGGEEVPPPGWIPYTPRVREVIGLAADEARRLGHDHVGTEHLLLGIIREGEGVANVILEKAGALDEVARVRTLALLDQREAEGTDTGA